MGLLPVLVVQQGQDSPLGQCKESAPSGGDLYQTLGAVQEPHHRFPLKEMHSTNLFLPCLASWRYATGCFVHAAYGITRGLTLSLNQAVKMDEALLARERRWLWDASSWGRGLLPSLWLSGWVGDEDPP